MASHLTRLFLATILLGPAGLANTAFASPLSQCLERQSLPRLVRFVGPDATPPRYGRVLQQVDGLPTAVEPVADGSVPLPEAIARAVEGDAIGNGAVAIGKQPGAARLCSPVPLTRAEIDAERKLVVAAGLNYAAHADEAGGGDVFIFPKPVAPTPADGVVAAPAGTTLLDYEVELGYVLLEDIDLRALPSREALLAASAFFVTNDVTDREPLIVHKALSGPGTGFVDGKGQPSFLPTGPWLIRGSELFAALDACGEAGLGLELAVDEGDGFATRQQATTAAMILDLVPFLERLGEQIEQSGPRTPMPLRSRDPERFYPMAIVGADGVPRLPAGSVVLTGTPEGVAMQAPSVGGVLFRGLIRFRGPLEQFRLEEIERARLAEPGGYLAPGDRVRASIDGLGSQLFTIAEPGSPVPVDPCHSD